MNADRMNPSASADATVVRGGGGADVVKGDGRYEFVCVGPVESDRERYVRLRDAIAEAEESGDVPRLIELRGEIQSIAMEEKWRDTVKNLITTVGKDDANDKYFKGSTYTQTIRMGLAGTGTKDAADTQASHAGWLEVGLTNQPTYTGNRKDVVMGASSGGVTVSPSQSFAITGSGTVSGCFINNGGSATKDNTTGILFSAGNFTGGDKVVANGDTLNVTYTYTLS